jgi:hypothetical protein
MADVNTSCVLVSVQLRPRFRPQMVIHDRGATDGHRKVLREFLEPVFQPLLAVVLFSIPQERAAATARHTVISAGEGHINQLGSSDHHRESPGVDVTTVHHASIGVEFDFPLCCE